MINITKIYLVENCYGDPNKVYIGKTINNRKNNHTSTYGKQIKYTYIDEVNSLDRKHWKPLETYWIHQFTTWGFELMNKHKIGGSGPINNLTKSKKVYQYSINGDLIKIWDSVTLAHKYLNITGIDSCARGEIKTIKGYVWLYGEKSLYLYRFDKKFLSNNNIGMKKPQTSKKLKGRKITWSHKLEKPRPQSFIEKKSKPILQYNLNMEFIKEWPSIKHAELIYNPPYAKKIQDNIGACCRGNRQSTAYGYIWKYKNQ